MHVSVATSFTLECYVFVIILIFLRNNPLESIYSTQNNVSFGSCIIHKAKSTKILSLFPGNNSMKSRRMKPKVCMDLGQGSRGKQIHLITVMAKRTLNLQ